MDGLHSAAGKLTRNENDFDNVPTVLCIAYCVLVMLSEVWVK